MSILMKRKYLVQGFKHDDDDDDNNEKWKTFDSRSQYDWRL